MKNFVNKVVKKLFWIIKKVFEKSYQKSFSQCGEDMIARFYLLHKNGFYIDIGAYHASKISNTKYFYKKGWRGINVDASEEVISNFKLKRPNDINLHCFVGQNDGAEVKFFKFISGALNTGSEKGLANIKKYHGQEPVDVKLIKVKSLSKILDEYLPENQAIDLLTIDAEGCDFDVLKSNNWVKYKPKVIIIEMHCSIYDFINSEMHNYMKNFHYSLGGYSRHSYIFCKNDLV